MSRMLKMLGWVVVATALLVAVEVLLLSTSVPRSARLMGVALVTDAPAAPFLSKPLPRWAGPRLRAVEIVMHRWPLGDTCLRRSLLTCCLLRPLAPVLRIGWLSTPAGGNAHAWVEVDGASLDGQLDGISPFVTR